MQSTELRNVYQVKQTGLDDRLYVDYKNREEFQILPNSETEFQSFRLTELGKYGTIQQDRFGGEM